MKTVYSHDYAPPAPVLEVGLAAPSEPAQVGPLVALIDTGADGTFVPTSLLEVLGVPVIYSTNVRSHLGEQLRRVSVHKIDLILGTIRLPNVDAVSDDWGDEIILGRNAFNKLRLVLDGPNQVIEWK
jgi:predicted aspartyl protease